MAGLTWIRFKKTGILKEVSTKIANNEVYQRDPDRGFEIVGAPQQPTPEPQKKIVPEKSEKAVVVNEDKEVTAQVETISIPEETKEEKVVRLHKEGKSEDEIKAETGLNKLTIRKLIKTA